MPKQTDFKMIHHKKPDDDPSKRSHDGAEDVLAMDTSSSETEAPLPGSKQAIDETINDVAKKHDADVVTDVDGSWRLEAGSKAKDAASDLTKDLFTQSTESTLDTAVVTFYPEVWDQSNGSVDPFIWHSSSIDSTPDEILKAILKISSNGAITGDKSGKLMNYFAQGLAKYLRLDPSSVKELLSKPETLGEFLDSRYSDALTDSVIGSVVEDSSDKRLKADTRASLQVSENEVQAPKYQSINGKGQGDDLGESVNDDRLDPADADGDHEKDLGKTGSSQGDSKLDNYLKNLGY